MAARAAAAPSARAAAAPSRRQPARARAPTRTQPHGRPVLPQLGEPRRTRAGTRASQGQASTASGGTVSSRVSSAQSGRMKRARGGHLATQGSTGTECHMTRVRRTRTSDSASLTSVFDCEERSGDPASLEVPKGESTVADTAGHGEEMVTTSIATEDAAPNLPEDASVWEVEEDPADNFLPLGMTSEPDESSPDIVKVEGTYSTGSQSPSRSLECPYKNDVLRHLCYLEQEQHVGAVYMSVQPSICAGMRATLIDWLVDVALAYKLAEQTLHLTITLVDRYLSRMLIKRNKLQLVGITCMHIACKLEEIAMPTIEDYVELSDNAYRKDEIVQMEAAIILKLDFRLNSATSFAFLAQFLEAADVDGIGDKTLEYLARYLCELALQDYACLRFLPSTLAAAAVCLARICLIGEPFWSPQLAELVQYSGSELRPCVLEMHAISRRAATSQLAATYNKYASLSRHKVSKITPPSHLPLF